MMTRREVLWAAGSASAFLAGKPATAQSGFLRNLGAAPAGFGAEMFAGGGRGGRGGRGRGAGDAPPSPPPFSGGAPRFDLIDFAHQNGLGVVETSLPARDPDSVKKFRERIESLQLRVILNAPLPKDQSEVETFDAAVKACKEAGAYSLHAAMTARRYEEFDAFEPFKQNFERCQKQIALAESVLRRYRLRLGIENHKGWRSAEQAGWIKRMSSEWIGVHLDFGNNLSLLEDPVQTLKTLYPYIIACHIKDMAVEPYEDGFLLSEVPLGDGFLDIKGMVEMVQKRDPNIPFDLEMITRDPLKIPIYTAKYWVTFDDSYSPLPGRDAAHVMDLVRKNKPRYPLPHTTGLSPEAQRKQEVDNNLKCIDWARRNLNLA